MSETRIQRMAASVGALESEALRDLARSAAVQLAEPEARGEWSQTTAVDVASWLCAAHMVLARRAYWAQPDVYD